MTGTPTKEEPPTAAAVRAALAEVADAEDAAFLQGFFKTGAGQYGEGDVLLGVRVPATRAVVARFRALPLDEVDVLLDSPVHEHRLAGLLVLVSQYARGSSSEGKASDSGDGRKRDIVDRYLAAMRRGRVNNWDLVDTSAPGILGAWLVNRPRDLLFELAASPALWDRRVAVIATQEFIHRGDATTTLILAERLLGDREDLIHKAVGWMLREVGKRVDRAMLTAFLDRHAGAMPRVMLSYATEHLAPDERQGYREQRRIA